MENNNNFNNNNNFKMQNGTAGKKFMGIKDPRAAAGVGAGMGAAFVGGITWLVNRGRKKAAEKAAKKAAAENNNSK